MKKYSIEGQNVYVAIPPELGAEIKLFAIATSVENAIEIASTLNAYEKHIKTK